MQQDLVFRVGGAAGDGVASTAESFAKMCSRMGLHTWTYSSYQSVIRGGHVWTQVRGGTSEVLSQGEDPDIVVALNQDTADVHGPAVRSGGALLYDEKAVKVDPSRLRPNVRALGLPLADLARQHGGNALMKNTVALGGVTRLFDMPFAAVEEGLRHMFRRKSAEVQDANVRSAKAGYDLVAERGGSLGIPMTFSGKRRYLMTGNQAFCLGALAAGCKFLAQYPMTPASGILHWMAANGPRHGVVVKQVEDELAGINMAVGAAFAGARSMVATSGGGFSLMVEALGQAGMTETGVVAVLVQRTGPSTGLPTKTEQGDLNLALGAGQGDWPRIILAPRNTAECFTTAVRAFNLAEVYQTPVIVMSDLYLGEGYRTVDAFDFNVPIIRGLHGEAKEGTPFHRYAFTPSGISPRSVPGQQGMQYVAGTDEHMESGELISDVLAGLPEYIDLRRQMMEKRMKKAEGARQDLEPPELWGPKDADLTIVSWGSSQGPVREAVLRLNENGGAGTRANSLEFRDLFPLRAEESAAILERSNRTLLVEANYTGQFARLLRAETGWRPAHTFLKYDGEPFAPGEVVAKAHEVLDIQEVETRA